MMVITGHNVASDGQGGEKEIGIIPFEGCSALIPMRSVFRGGGTIRLLICAQYIRSSYADAWIW